jgi:hypothetical protein
MIVAFAIQEKQWEPDSLIPDTMLLSESVLAKDWNSPEEDAAWQKL